MRVNCREQIANPAEPVNGQDERRKCAAVDSPARFRRRVIKGRQTKVLPPLNNVDMENRI